MYHVVFIYNWFQTDYVVQCLDHQGGKNRVCERHFIYYDTLTKVFVECLISSILLVSINMTNFLINTIHLHVLLSHAILWRN